MHLLAAAALLLTMQGDLYQYDLVIDPASLNKLYENPFSGLRFPAVLVCEQGESSCLAGFRGTTSIVCPKKSWSVELDDPNLLGRSRLILDAHFRDSTLTRNCLAMMITDMLGYPAPDTRHVRFSVNGEYYGVYLDTEAVDTDFLIHSGSEGRDLYKAVAHQARFSWLPSGYWFDQYFEPHLDSDPTVACVRRLVDSVNLGEPLPPMDTEAFLAYYAVTLAVMDLDASTKNFYLHIPTDSVWRIYPWDRDATFGNDWLGRYDPGLAQTTVFFGLMKTAMFCRLMEDPANRVFFTACLDSTGVLMTEVLPGKIDSIRGAIMDDVIADPLAGLTQEQFDRAFDDLNAFVSQRQAYIQGLGSFYIPPGVESVRISPAHLSPGSDSVRVRVTAQYALAGAELEFSADGAPVETVLMSPVGGSGNRSWHGSVPADGIDSQVLFSVAMYPSAGAVHAIPWFFPAYGFFGYPAKVSAHPGSVRPMEVFEPESLTVLPPMRFGPDLWALPITSSHQSTQDLSHCVISLGDPAGTVFLPGSVFIPPGDTLFVTSSVRAMDVEFPWRTCVGDCTAPSPAGTDMVLMDPSWETRLQVPVPGEDTLESGPLDIVLSEICYQSSPAMDSGDWIELYNPDTRPVDIGGFLLLDGSGNMSMIPWGLYIGAGRLFMVSCDPNRFVQVNPRVHIGALMSFHLGDNGDTITLLDRRGRTVFTVTYTDNTPWPDASGMVLSLLHYTLPASAPDSWEAVEAPGSPGTLNPAWSGYGFLPLSILNLWPNPASSSLSFTYTCQGEPVTGSLFDLQGRLVQRLPDLPPVSSDIYVELEPDLASGVYFLVLQSSGDCSVRRFVCLR